MKRHHVIQIYLWLLVAGGALALAYFPRPIQASPRPTIRPVRRPQKVRPQKGQLLLVGVATQYSDWFNGRKTANDEVFSQQKFTAAVKQRRHLGRWLLVSRGNRVVRVKINDTGTLPYPHPYRHGFRIDLSRAAAQRLGLKRGENAQVRYRWVVGR